MLPGQELVFSEAELLSLPPLVSGWSGLVLVLGFDLVDNSSFSAVSSASILIILSWRKSESCNWKIIVEQVFRL